MTWCCHNLPAVDTSFQATGTVITSAAVEKTSQPPPLTVLCQSVSALSRTLVINMIIIMIIIHGNLVATSLHGNKAPMQTPSILYPLFSSGSKMWWAWQGVRSAQLNFRSPHHGGVEKHWFLSQYPEIRLIVLCSWEKGCSFTAHFLWFYIFLPWKRENCAVLKVISCNSTHFAMANAVFFCSNLKTYTLKIIALGFFQFSLTV